MTPRPRRARGRPRRTTVALPVRAWRAARVSVHVLAGIATTSFVFPRAPSERRRALTLRWCRKLLALMDIDARVHGTIDATGGNVLIVANHISWLDIFVLNAQHASLFVAKSELADWPVAGLMSWSRRSVSRISWEPAWTATSPGICRFPSCRE